MTRLRGLRIAAQFLTRLRIPTVQNPTPHELSHSAAWFPLVGFAIGILVAAVGFTVEHSSRPLAAMLALLTWVWLTGALHLDGLADLVDALAAAHRDPARFFPVLADPHIGTFGVVSIVLVLLLKAAALTQVSGPVWLAIALIPAWSRLGPLAWSQWLAPLKAGSGERFAWQLHAGWTFSWTLLLLAITLLVAPVLCLAPAVIALWGIWLHFRLGGMTGDCLGAGVEICETVLLLALALAGPGSVSILSALSP